MSTDPFTTLAYAAGAIVAIGVLLALVAYVVLRATLVRASDRVAGRLQAFVLPADAAPGASRGASRGLREPQAAPSQSRGAEGLARLDRLARLMDEAVRVPGVGGVGLDAALGLIPVAGDAASFVIGAGLVVRALRLGVPREVVAKMIANVCLDLAIGALPVVGDLADVFFRSNARNMRLLREALRGSGLES